jgi:fumarylacetoacetase
MEFAAIVGKPLAMNQGLTVKEADEHIFGFVIVNDWSCEFRCNRYGELVLM